MGRIQRPATKILTAGFRRLTVNQDQADRIARMLYRISDRGERDEVTREIGKVLEQAESGFDLKRFYELANVPDPGVS